MASVYSITTTKGEKDTMIMDH